MADYSRPSFRTYGGDKKLEIVNGKVFSANQIYVQQRWRSPDPPPLPPFPSRTGKASKSSSASSSSSIKKWSFNDPEMKRRKRVAQYKAYAIEGKVKSSFRRSVKWIQKKCSEIIHGF